jgi:hypothetical protein
MIRWQMPMRLDPNRIAHTSYLVFHLHLHLLGIHQHFRNFITELPKRWKSKGFEELSPNRTANELFPHLQPGAKVAIVSRFQTPHTLAYVDAFQERGLQVRTITKATGVQDFCFLLKTKRELAGSTRSTYCFWAALLGNATTNWLYSIASTSKYPNHLGNNNESSSLFQYNWTHPEIRSRVRFPVFWEP